MLVVVAISSRPPSSFYDNYRLFISYHTRKSAGLLSFLGCFTRVSLALFVLALKKKFFRARNESTSDTIDKACSRKSERARKRRDANNSLPRRKLMRNDTFVRSTEIHCALLCSFLYAVFRCCCQVLQYLFSHGDVNEQEYKTRVCFAARQPASRASQTSQRRSCSRLLLSPPSVSVFILARRNREDILVDCHVMSRRNNSDRIV